MLKKISIVVLVVLLFLTFLKAEDSKIILFKNDFTNKKIQELADGKIFANKTAGMLILVQKDGEIQYLKAFGYADLKDRQKTIRSPKLMKTDTIFDLASLTKVLATTQATMMLIYEDKLQLTDKVSRYIEEFNTADKSNITIYDLLTHSSGLPAWRPLYMYVDNKKDVVKYIANIPLSYKTKTNQIYSDLGFIILGIVIEKISEKSLDDYLTDNLYSKLEMFDSGYNLSEDKKIRSASTSWGNIFEKNMIKNGKYGLKDDPKRFKKWRNYTLKGEVDDGNAFYVMEGISGHAGLFSSGIDISKLIQLMLNGGTYNGVTFYSQDIMNQFSEIQKLLGLKGRAIGFDYSRDYMGKNRPQRTFGHIGFTGNCLAINKENNIGILILSNRENVGLNSQGSYTGFNELCTDIMDAVYDNYR